MDEFYSDSLRAPPGSFSYDLPVQPVRQRILFALKRHCEGNNGSFELMIDELGTKLREKYGKLDGNNPYSPLNAQVMAHLAVCDSPRFLDFVLQCFRNFQWRGRQTGVEELNQIFREEGIGYQFSPYAETVTGRTGPRGGGREIDIQYPKVIVKKNEIVHQHAVQPVVNLLSDHRFKVANDEFLKAHEDYRSGRLEDALTSCGSAFESVLKTICVIKKFDSDPDFNPKAALANLLKFCIQKKLIDSIYENSFVSVATVRNALSSAHGRGGPNPPPVVTPEKVEHILNVTASHMLLVFNLAKV
jgi:hypothetical protein